MISRADSESYRATLQARTPDGHVTTVIVTRQGLGREERVWLTMQASIRTTIVLTDAQATSLVELLQEAGRATQS